MPQDSTTPRSFLWCLLNIRIATSWLVHQGEGVVVQDSSKIEVVELLKKLTSRKYLLRTVGSYNICWVSIFLEEKYLEFQNGIFFILSFTAAGPSSD